MVRIRFNVIKSLMYMIQISIYTNNFFSSFERLNKVKAEFCTRIIIIKLMKNKDGILKMNFDTQRRAKFNIKNAIDFSF